MQIGHNDGLSIIIANDMSSYDYVVVTQLSARVYINNDLKCSIASEKPLIDITFGEFLYYFNMLNEYKENSQ